MTVAEDPRFAPPQAYVADVASDEKVLAGRGTRLLAAVVDGLVVGGIVWVVMLLPFIQPLVTRQVEAGLSSVNLLSLPLGLAAFLLVQAWPLLTRGQTVGKMLFGLRIVRTDGSRPDAWRLLGLRYGIGLVLNFNAVVSMIYGLVDSLLIFRGSRQCLHDSIADTQVIKL